jgi:hypothetical protein
MLRFLPMIIVITYWIYNFFQEDFQEEFAVSDVKYNLKQTFLFRFIDNQDGTITDQETNLQWMRCSIGQRWNGTACIGHPSRMTWNEAMPNGKHKVWTKFAGYDDWRLPDIDELKTIVYCSSKAIEPSGRRCDGNYHSPTIDLKAFPNAPSTDFWSASPDARDSFDAWYIYLDDGSISTMTKNSDYAVRLVRSRMQYN